MQFIYLFDVQQNAVRRINSVDTNYGMALKYHTYTVVTGY